MTDWLKQYWWAIWGIGASTAWFAWRIHRDKDGGSTLQRIRRIINHVDGLTPEQVREQNNSYTRQLLLLVGGLLFLAACFGILHLLKR